MSMADGSPDYPTIAADIGLVQLRATYPWLTGAGVNVGQVEGDSTGANGPGAIAFEVAPAQEGHPADNSDHFFTYHNGIAQTSIYNDGTIGTYSRHASFVATFFYDSTIYDGAPTGIAPDVAHVDNYNAANFLENLLSGPLPDKVVNMSFLYGSPTNLDPVYDAAANLFGTVFVASAGNGGTPGSPSSAYNVISVDSSIQVQAIGPASDGVPKPDISAPQTATSRTAPIVSGCATLLIQAAQSGWSGASAQSHADAQDFRTVKALLLNGATKPADYYTTPYAPSATQPLNAVYGAGVVNIFNSVNELYSGEHGPSATFATAAGSTRFTATTAVPTIPTEGWNLGHLAAAAGQDEADRYAFNLVAGETFEATLTWAADASNDIDQLRLDFYDNATGKLIASSAAPASNVQQIEVTLSQSGRYDLDVVLEGSSTVPLADTYALAFGPVSPACFAAGTRIATDHGETMVQHLQVGDRVRLAHGGSAAVVWLGHRRVDCRRHPRRADVLPVRIAAHAFGLDRPHRDLRLSPDHAVLVDGVLIPVRYLLNEATLRQEDAAAVTYWHVELPEHGILLADGMPAESYLDTGNRPAFTNGDATVMAHPDFARGVWARHGCAPLITEGPVRDLVYRRLIAQAFALGWRQQSMIGDTIRWLPPDTGMDRACRN